MNKLRNNEICTSSVRLSVLCSLVSGKRREKFSSFCK